MAGNGIDALRVVSEHRPDLIVLDVVMPEMDGKEFLKRLRSLDGAKNIPVVIITVSSDVAFVKELAILGVSGYLLRPFSADQFVRCDAKALQLDAKPNPDKSDEE